MNETYLKSLQEGLKEILKHNSKAIVIGEDIVDPYGGAFKATAGLSTLFPNQVISTPISEAAITGIGTGLALRGFNPIVEIMFGDFLTLCSDQIINHATKFVGMFPNVTCPLIIRTPMGGGRGYGPTHSQSLEKHFLGIPNLKIIAPSHFHKPGETLLQISKSESTPVLFVENKILYGIKIEKTSNPISIETTIDSTTYKSAICKNYQAGTPDICIIGYGGISRFLPNLMRKMAEDEIRMIAILPECIDPIPIELICHYSLSAKKVIIIDESCEHFSWADGVAKRIYDNIMSDLNCPIKVLNTERSIIPTSFEEEQKMLVNEDKIEKAILELISWV